MQACCLSLGAGALFVPLCRSSVVAASLPPQLPPEAVPGDYAEARLDLSMELLDYAVLLGFSDARGMCEDAALWAVREHRPLQFVAAVGAAVTAAGSGAGTPPTPVEAPIPRGSSCKSEPALQGSALPVAFSLHLPAEAARSVSPVPVRGATTSLRMLGGVSISGMPTTPLSTPRRLVARGPTPSPRSSAQHFVGSVRVPMSPIGSGQIPSHPHKR